MLYLRRYVRVLLPLLTRTGITSHHIASISSTQLNRFWFTVVAALHHYTVDVTMLQRVHCQYYTLHDTIDTTELF